MLFDASESAHAEHLAPRQIGETTPRGIDYPVRVLFAEHIGKKGFRALAESFFGASWCMVRHWRAGRLSAPRHIIDKLDQHLAEQAAAIERARALLAKEKARD